MADIFIKWGDNITGESTENGHEDCSELQSLNVGASLPVGQRSGTGGGAEGGVSFQDFSISKLLDKASADLFISCCNGTMIPGQVVVTVIRSTKDREIYLQYEMDHVFVSHYSISGMELSRPIESVSLNPGKIKMLYTPFDNEGKAGTTLDKTWDLETNVHE